MRVRWRSFELPNRVVFEEETLNLTYGKFTAEPFERGFGTTVGNSLRRILLSSIEGAAVTKIKIQGVKHEYTSIEGIVEDVTDMILNIKQLLIKLHKKDEVMMTLKSNKKGEVTAANITEDSRFEIVNPELHICTLTKDVDFHMNLWARRGRGYVTAEENIEDEPEIGIIPVDSIFSPIRRVKFSTENTRVGKMTDYDRLIMEIITDGTVDPKMALIEAAKIMRKHLNPFIQYTELGESFHSKQEIGFEDTSLEEEYPVKEPVEGVERETSEPGEDILSREISELNLGNRAMNGLRNAFIDTIGKLIQLTEEELRNLPKLGATSVTKIKESLGEHGLSLKNA